MAVVERATSLLEAKDYAAFFTQCVRPSEVADMVEELGSIEKLAEAYAESNRAASMLAVLKAATKVAPTFDADGTRATFAFDEPVERERRLVLQKIDGKWYLVD
jgi:hypothetical protein